MSQRRVSEPAAFERAHYVRTVGTFFSLSDPLAAQSVPIHGRVSASHAPLD
jgi:hypothetical protein